MGRSVGVLQNSLLARLASWMLRITTTIHCPDRLPGSKSSAFCAVAYNWVAAFVFHVKTATSFNCPLQIWYTEEPEEVTVSLLIVSLLETL